MCIYVYQLGIIIPPRGEPQLALLFRNLLTDPPGWVLLRLHLEKYPGTQVPKYPGGEMRKMQLLRNEEGSQASHGPTVVLRHKLTLCDVRIVN